MIIEIIASGKTMLVYVFYYMITIYSEIEYTILKYNPFKSKIKREPYRAVSYEKTTHYIDESHNEMKLINYNSSYSSLITKIVQPASNSYVADQNVLPEPSKRFFCAIECIALGERYNIDLYEPINYYATSNIVNDVFWKFYMESVHNVKLESGNYVINILDNNIKSLVIQSEDEVVFEKDSYSVRKITRTVDS